MHDGNVDTLFNFFLFPGFQFDGGAAGDQQRQDVVAFMMAFSIDTHAGVGVQATIGSDVEQSTLRDEMLAVADSGAVGLVVKGVVDGAQRGWAYLGGGALQSDRTAEIDSVASLDALAGDGTELTWTLVPDGTQTRLGIDRDGDGFFDRDEIDACADPADPQSIPGGNTCTGDIDGTGSVDTTDLLALLGQWGLSGSADLDCSGTVDTGDLLTMLGAWGDCP